MYRSQPILFKGFLTESGALPLKVFIDGVFVQDFQITENCFELKIEGKQDPQPERKINSYSFITFAVPYNKRLCFGINSIKIL